MYIASFRFSALRTAVIVLALGILIAFAIWPRGGLEVEVSAGDRFSGISTNEKRVEVLRSYGWQVNQTPLEVVEFIVPQTFDKVYMNYNAIQKNQGFDLSQYKGKRVKRWTYQISNYPDGTQGVRANLLIYGDRVIGGDVSAVALNGFMYGLSRSSQVNPATGSANANITLEFFSKTE